MSLSLLMIVLNVMAGLAMIGVGVLIVRIYLKVSKIADKE